jgi:hypothetical protein
MSATIGRGRNVAADSTRSIVEIVRTNGNNKAISGAGLVMNTNLRAISITIAKKVEIAMSLAIKATREISVRFRRTRLTASSVTSTMDAADSVREISMITDVPGQEKSGPEEWIATAGKMTALCIPMKASRATVMKITNAAAGTNARNVTKAAVETGNPAVTATWVPMVVTNGRKASSRCNKGMAPAVGKAVVIAANLASGPITMKVTREGPNRVMVILNTNGRSVPREKNIVRRSGIIIVPGKPIANGPGIGRNHAVPARNNVPPARA